jgi:hypothetical protein
MSPPEYWNGRLFYRKVGDLSRLNLSANQVNSIYLYCAVTRVTMPGIRRLLTEIQLDTRRRLEMVRKYRASVPEKLPGFCQNGGAESILKPRDDSIYELLAMLTKEVIRAFH